MLSSITQIVNEYIFKCPTKGKVYMYLMLITILYFSVKHKQCTISVKPGPPRLTATSVIAGRRVNIVCTSDGRPLPLLRIVPVSNFIVKFEDLATNRAVNQTHVQTVVSAIAKKSWHNQTIQCHRTTLFPTAHDYVSKHLHCFCKYNPIKHKTCMLTSVLN